MRETVAQRQARDTACPKAWIISATSSTLYCKVDEGASNSQPNTRICRIVWEHGKLQRPAAVFSDFVTQRSGPRSVRLGTLTALGLGVLGLCLATFSSCLVGLNELAYGKVAADYRRHPATTRATVTAVGINGFGGDPLVLYRFTVN